MFLRKKFSRRASLAIVFALLSAAAVAGPFKGARDFAGAYGIVKATPEGNNVVVRLWLRVMNYGGADVNGATISLVGRVPHPPGATEAWEKANPVFRGLVLRVNEHRVVPPLEGSFTVPAREYAQWQRGNGPQFVIEFREPSGQARREVVELTRH
jgi:hypothetical protein